MNTAATQDAPATLAHKILLLARDIKLSHSVFALPFALLATFLAAQSQQRTPSLAELVLIVLCMVLARTVAMVVNRWADARLDAANPRTARRAVASGRLSRPFALAAALTCSLLFFLAASGFWWLRDNPWPLIFSPLVLAWLCVYSFTKRFTWACHLVLGIALALSPVAATLAIHPAFLLAPEPWLLALMVTCWVAGFDVIYSLQDVAIDRASGLFSMPSRLGVEPALWASRFMHAGAFALLLALTWRSTALGPLFSIGVGVVAALLLLEHALVWGSRTHHINVAFLTVNGIISLMLGGLGIADILLALP